MARRPRLAAQAAQASMRTPIPNISDNEDEEMADASPGGPATPQDDEENGENEEDEDMNEAEEAPTPSRDSAQPSRSATPRRGRPSLQFGRRKRLGRPPKNRQPLSDDENNDATSEVSTPKRRGGFRGHRGGRWRGRGGVTRTPAPLDLNGNPMQIVNDEVELPGDPEGETKVDKRGQLLDGREYRVRTFTIMGRDERLYMLSTEPARCIGFRDSYLFFQKHPNLYKIIIDDDEKRDLIERDVLPHSYKGRAIGVVTARSVFREFGAKIVIGGKKVIDDYQTQAARERGDVEGELAVPDDRLPAPGEPYNRNQYVAWHGASAVYHTNASSVPGPIAKAQDIKRRKIVVTSDNWMYEHAREASRFNSMLTAARSDNQNGVYDIHTNAMHWPSYMQPTHARWEVVHDENDFELLEQVPRLPKLDPVYGRNFRIHDLCLETAPESWLGRPGSDGEDEGLSSIPATILEELPPECLDAFEAAKSREASWRSKWHSERADGLRAHFLSSVDWYPR
ncbi:chromatin remodelling complex Rsc7/Swp82 subunit-domain-containing protein [Exophiala viscosa]|uniref:chromatin remodelling complex Rsc7/Swp82 subunit-domain-containing protein n=1 Tax=Exophiala viscosa TaxID=2486360 RepID=UPI00219E9429|nr:chromatin remodelling complex Rsc7/Swp82 subunit-domain-containing protein [Exophiala viscosa]